MTLTIDDVVTHYILSSHPRNKAIIDIKNKKTGVIRFIKIRHRMSKFYAVSLVDPVTFEVWAETQVKSASARIKPIILHTGENKNDTPVELRDTSRIGFEWSFVWEGEKYRWVRESRMSNSLECRAIRKTGDICVAQYLPRMLKDEYFGIFSLLGYNMLRCNLTKSRELELIILMSLMTLLDKSDDGGWKKDSISKGVKEDIIGGYNSNNNSTEHNNSSNNNNSDVPPFTYEDPIPKKSLQKKYKVELLNDQKLQLMLEKDVRRSQKQIQSDQKNKPLSAGNSPSHTPKGSPLPTPSASTTLFGFDSPRTLTKQKSACNLNYYKDSSPNSDMSTTPTNKNSSGGKLSRIFSNLSHPKQINVPSTATPADSKNTSPVETNRLSSVYNKSNDILSTSHKDMSHNNYNSDQKLQKKQQQQQQQRPPQYDHPSYYDNQHSLPTGQLSRFTNEFGNLTLNNHYDNYPTNVRSIRWNPEPLLTPSQTSAPIVNNTPNKYIKRTPSSSRQQQPLVITSQQIHHRSQSQDRRRPLVLDKRNRRMSASEYPVYAYHPHSQQPQQHYGYIQPTTNNYNNRYSTSEYYAYQQQQHQYDYYQ